MYGRKHIHRVAALLTAVAALAFFAGSVQAANSRPAGMTKAEYRALMLRSEALNRQYGLGSGTYKPAARNAILRNDRAHFRNERVSQTAGRSPAQAQAPAPILVRVDGGFDWGDAVIGGAFGLALALVGTGAILIGHRIRSTPRPV